jgi:NNP family nitrate/nitrite transporter-like MFS transporter
MPSPFCNEKNVGLVNGIVGAGGFGGNVIRVFSKPKHHVLEAFKYISMIAVVVAFIILLTRFAKEKAPES